MDLTGIAAVIGSAGAIVGASGGFFFARKAYKKKQNNEADNVAIQGLEQANKDLREDNNRLRTQLDRERARNEDAEARKDAKIEQLYDEKNEEREGRVTAESGFCRHFGCACREPAIGQGREWIEAHKNEPALGVDYLPINQLMLKLGERRKAKQAEKGPETGQK